MAFSRQEYWSGLPFSSPGIFLAQGSYPGLLSCRQMLYHWSHQGLHLILQLLFIDHRVKISFKILLKSWLKSYKWILRSGVCRSGIFHLMIDEFMYLHKYSLCLLLFEIMKEKHCILSDCQWKESRVLSVTLPRKSHYKLWQHFSSGKFCFLMLPETLGTSGPLNFFYGLLFFKKFLCHPTFFDINAFPNIFILCGVKWWENIFENYILWSSSITCKIWHFAYIFNTQGLLLWWTVG